MYRIVGIYVIVHRANFLAVILEFICLSVPVTLCLSVPNDANFFGSSDWNSRYNFKLKRFSRAKTIVVDLRAAAAAAILEAGLSFAAETVGVVVISETKHG